MYLKCANHKSWSLFLVMMAALLFRDMSCTPYQFVKLAKDNKLTITPSPVFIQNDSLKFDVYMEIPPHRFLKRKHLEMNLYLRSNRKEQLVFKKVLPIDFNSMDTVQAFQFSIAVPLEIPIDQMARLETHLILLQKKNGGFQEFPRLGIAEVFADSLTMKTFIEHQKK